MRSLKNVSNYASPRDDNELVGAQKTPSLRNITETAPYMHGGQIADLTSSNATLQRRTNLHA
jgi:cytochrome c peroxidase